MYRATLAKRKYHELLNELSQYVKVRLPSVVVKYQARVAEGALGGVCEAVVFLCVCCRVRLAVTLLVMLCSFFSIMITVLVLSVCLSDNSKRHRPRHRDTV